MSIDPTLPSPIAYAVPASDVVAGRVRRVVALAGIAIGATNLASSMLYLLLVLGVVPSSAFGGGLRSGGQQFFQLLSVALDVPVLVGGALLFRGDSTVARTLLRLGFGAKFAALFVAVAISLSSYPPSLTLGDRAYLLIANAAGHVVMHATLFALTFALPPRRMT